MRKKQNGSIVFLFKILFFVFVFSSTGPGPIFALEKKEVKIIPLPTLVNPTCIKVDSGKIFIMEEESICVFSLDDFSLLFKFGRRGEGPGEFKSPPYVIPRPTHLFVLDTNKALLVSLAGELIEELKIPFYYNYGFFPLLSVGENYVGFPLERIEGQGFGHIGRLYDKAFQSIKDIYGYVPSMVPPPPPPPRPGETSRTFPKQDYEAIPDYVDLAEHKDNFFIADTRKGFFITVFNSQGNVLYEIDREYNKIKVPKIYRDTYMKELHEQSNWERLNNRYNFVFKDFFPAFFAFKIDNQKIYALTYAQKDSLYEVIQMDLKGNFLNKSFIFPFKPFGRLNETFFLISNDFDIHADQIFHLEYNYDTEVIELNITPIK